MEYIDLKSVTVNNRQLCDLELLLVGAFSPLKGFMKENDYLSVVEKMRLEDGNIWTIPIVLAVSDTVINDIKKEKRITLRNQEGLPIAMMEIESIYKPDLINECFKVFGTNDENHPYVKIIMQDKNVHYIGGTVSEIRLPPHYDFNELRLTPADTKKFFAENKWDKIVGFQTRNPMHRSHIELSLKALSKVPDSRLLLHPVVGITQECDIDYHTRVRCYKALLKHYPEGKVKLALLPLSMRMAGPREAVWHALIRKNYGCTHFVVGRDHAGPSYKRSDGKSFYGPYDAHALLEKFGSELGIQIIKSENIVYVQGSSDSKYVSMDELDKIQKQDPNAKILEISGTQFRDIIVNNKPIPEWFSYPDIIRELRLAQKPKGLCVYLVGLSCSGKTTIANALYSKLLDIGERRTITILDGDVIRLNLSKGLGFTKEDRSINVRRIGYVASEIVKHGGIVLCANIAPFETDRIHNRSLISQYGSYFEIYVKTPLNICEERDVKGLYKLARQNKIKNFTGISDPFEEPTSSDMIIDCSNEISKIVNDIITKLHPLLKIEN